MTTWKATGRRLSFEIGRQADALSACRGGHVDAAGVEEVVFPQGMGRKGGQAFGDIQGDRRFGTPHRHRHTPDLDHEGAVPLREKRTELHGRRLTGVPPDKSISQGRGQSVVTPVPASPVDPCADARARAVSVDGHLVETHHGARLLRLRIEE